MEFWGMEVKPGQSVKVSTTDDLYLHLSQGAFGETKKDDKATMFVKVDDQKLSIGTLSTNKFPQLPFDLVFEKEFELSHTSKFSSVFFSGYKVFVTAGGDEMFDSEEESEDEEEEVKIVPVTKGNGKAEAKNKEPKQVKIGSAAAKPKSDAKLLGKSKKDEDSDEDDESDDDSDGALIPIEGDDSELSEADDSSEDDEEEEEETPKICYSLMCLFIPCYTLFPLLLHNSQHERYLQKPETGKKRAVGSVLKMPASGKKAKVATPSGQKTGDKKGAVHVATPHPAKNAGKTPATNEKSPKSGGSVACKSCSKTFNSENALQAHLNAKHKVAAK